jgi:pimeloyl-ACP methyl ester carboxylesterase
LLPGAMMTPGDMVTAGFAVERDKQGVELDLWIAPLDTAGVPDGSTLKSIQRELIEPARRRYSRVWMGGISLGGLTTLVQAADHPSSLDGLCLIAPYPGSRLVTNAIALAGGLDRWSPTDEQLHDPEYRVWHWLKSPPADLPVFVGHGMQDRFASGMHLLAERFGPASRHLVEGKHDWPAWTALWQRFLRIWPTIGDHGCRG